MRRLVPLFSLLSLVAIVSLAPSRANADEARIKPVYRVAIDKEYAPYEFVDLDGGIKGFTPDLLREIGRSAGVTFDLRPMDWPEAVAALDEGRIDLINMIRTAQRQEKYAFSAPHSYIRQAIFRHVTADEIGGLESLTGHRVALQRNDIAYEMLADRTDFEKQLVQSKADGFLLLNAGKGTRCSTLTR